MIEGTYYAKNRDKVLARQKAKYQTEKGRQYYIDYYQKNGVYICARERQRYRTNTFKKNDVEIIIDIN